MATISSSIPVSTMNFQHLPLDRCASEGIPVGGGDVPGAPDAVGLASHRDLHGRRNAICSNVPLISGRSEQHPLRRQRKSASAIADTGASLLNSLCGFLFRNGEPAHNTSMWRRRNAICESVGTLEAQSLLEFQLSFPGQISSGACRSGSLSRSSMSSDCASLPGVRRHSRHKFEIEMERLSFNAFDWSEDEMMECFEWVLCHSAYCSPYQLPQRTVRAFLHRVRMGYAKYANPFHCFRHAFDVFSFTFLLLGPGGASHHLNSLEMTALLVAAICHDLEHPGTDFAFQDSLSTRVGTNYRGCVSPLERHHLACTLAIFADDDCDIFKSMSKRERDSIVSIIEACILGTDMALHSDILQSYRNSLQGENGGSGSTPNPLLFLQLLLKASDISNLCRPWTLSVRWTQCLVDELVRVHSAVLGLGQVPNAFLCQAHRGPHGIVIGFAEHLAQPLFEQLAEVLPRTRPALLFLRSNLHNWKTASDFSLPTTAADVEPGEQGEDM